MYVEVPEATLLYGKQTHWGVSPQARPTVDHTSGQVDSNRTENQTGYFVLLMNYSSLRSPRIPREALKLTAVWHNWIPATPVTSLTSNMWCCSFIRLVKSPNWVFISASLRVYIKVIRGEIDLGRTDLQIAILRERFLKLGVQGAPVPVRTRIDQPMGRRSVWVKRRFIAIASKRTETKGKNRSPRLRRQAISADTTPCTAPRRPGHCVLFLHHNLNVIRQFVNSGFRSFSYRSA
jgi:hypothetical protein